MRERFWGAYKLELRQILRQWSYWLIQTILFAYMVRTFASGSEFFTAQELLWAGASRNVIGLSSLLVLLFGAFGAGRARRSRMDVLEATLPTGAEIPMARWAALVTASLPFLLSALGIALTAGPLESFLRGLPVFLLESLLTLIFTASLVWLIEVTIGVRRWMYPVLALVWLAAIFAISLSSVAFFAPWAGQWNFTRFGYGSYSEAWGRLAQGDFPWLLNWFYLGMVVLLIGLIVRAADRRRFYRTTGLVRGVVGTGAVIALAGYGLYGFNFIETIAQTNSPFSATPAETFYFDPSQPVYDVAVMPYAVTRYDIALDLEATPVFDVTLGVENKTDEPLESLDFTLNKILDVTSASADFTREGEYLTFTLAEPLPPRETVTIVLQYTGEMLTYQYIWGAPPELDSFITDDGIVLKHHDSWYPLAGRAPVATGLIVTVPPAEFTLRVTGTDLPLASNLPRTEENTFESKSSSWATLIGAPLLETHEPADGIHIITTAHQYDRLAEFMETGFQPGRDLVKRYFPDDTVVFLTQPRWYFMIIPTIYQPLAMEDHAAVIAQPPWNAQATYWFYDYGIYLPAQHFFGDTSMTMLTENVAQFVHLQILHGSADEMREALQFRLDNMYHGTAPEIEESQELLYASPGFAYNYAITAKLIDVYESHGMDGVAALLNAMQAEAATLRVSVSRVVVAWIDAWVSENLADA
jgi:hypothetical protein